ncbi:Uncharacterised protein [Mycobacteroides abscessus subsp. abscessus]|nr:Uncharacterised protein [Mycobacteroides abscessus subsp. abscessus]
MGKSRSIFRRLVEGIDVRLEWLPVGGETDGRLGGCLVGGGYLGMNAGRDGHDARTGDGDTSGNPRTGGFFGNFDIALQGDWS